MLVSVCLLNCSPLLFVALLIFLYLDVASRATRQNHHSQLVKSVKGGRLSDMQLKKLPKITRKELSLEDDCAICLDVIENEQPATLVPGCNHGFHLECVELWLSKRPFCPVCPCRLLRLPESLPLKQPTIFAPSVFLQHHPYNLICDSWQRHLAKLSLRFCCDGSTYFRLPSSYSPRIKLLSFLEESCIP